MLNYSFSNIRTLYFSRSPHCRPRCNVCFTDLCVIRKGTPIIFLQHLNEIMRDYWANIFCHSCIYEQVYMQCSDLSI
uniref:ZmAO-1 n=1 Tax=Arundo donax TaxID=35708 RepID=A0A0A9RRD4_ARUDO